MIFYCLDKIVDYRLKQKDKKINLKKASLDVGKYIKEKISNTKKSLFFKEKINNNDFETIVLSKKNIEKTKNNYNSILIEYAISKELSENGYSTLTQSMVTRKLREKKII